VPPLHTHDDHAKAVISLREYAPKKLLHGVVMCRLGGIMHAHLWPDAHQVCPKYSKIAGMKGIVEEQHLFTIHVHLPPNKTLEGPATMFNGHEIPGSIQTGASLRLGSGPQQGLSTS